MINSHAATSTRLNGSIVSRQELADKIIKFQVYAPQIAAKSKPGQFIILRLSDNGERIPLTIVDQNARSGVITLVVQGVGKSTQLLNNMTEGEVIHDVFGPLGNPSEVKNFGNVAMIGGGLGAAVAFPVAKALKQAGNHVTCIVGARNKDLIILKDEIDQVSDETYYTTDDGSYGMHGLVTTQLQQLIDLGKHFDYVLAVGPLPMMKAISEVTRPYAIPTTVSLNTIMIDGTGMCGGCRVQVGDKVRFTCVEGPEFDGHLVDFDTIIQRNRTYNHPEDCRIDTQVQEILEHEPEVAQEEHLGVRLELPERSVSERVVNFSEVTMGYDLEMARQEAARCINCSRPRCVQGCPVSVQIPQFIQLLLAGDLVEAGRKIKEDNALPRVCGRVCPQSDQCEGACILNRKGNPVNVGALERFVSDFYAENEKIQTKPAHPAIRHKVALVGSGPASLSCASDLAKAGCDVTVFEAFHEFGGVLRYGIPEFRLPKAIVSNEVNALVSQGVKFVPNTLIGATYSIDDLLGAEGFEALFIGSGAGLPNFLNLPGESLVGIYSANEFLTRVNLMKAYQYPKVDTPVLNMFKKRVGVFGGGNTALDSARVAIRLGAAEVSIIYRRSEVEMPGRVQEIAHAKAEGVRFDYLRNPTSFVGDEMGRITGVSLLRMELGEADSSGRRRPIPLADSDYFMPIDAAIIAIGNGSNPIISKNTPLLNVDKYGHIQVNPETMETSMAGVFAGGDIVTGGATVILAMGAGRKAAAAMLAFLNKKTGSDN
ncbi:MAG: NADPH-dependent glutamate synthase [Anaerolineaceae bacterium]